MFISKTKSFFTLLFLLIICGCADSDSDLKVPITSIEILPAECELCVGETVALALAVEPVEAFGAKVSWVSSNPKVATVSDGKVTAIAEGSATIIASVGNKQAECKITVCPYSWIDPEFAKVLQQRGYIKDASTVRPSEVENLTYIYVSGTYSNYGSLTTLRGIEYFSSLKYLYCSCNQLTSLDLSRNTQLTDLYCDLNNLTTLDVSKNTQLTELDCHSNKLTTLDVSKNTQLTHLDCYYNNLTTLDVSKNTQLTHLLCYSNNLTTLDVSKNTQLTYLYCLSNNLTTLDVSKNTQLKELYCNYNNLTLLDVSKNTALKDLFCNYNNLTSLDISNNTSLDKFICEGNPGSNGWFRVKAWFDNNSVPSSFSLGIDYKSLWTYNGSTVRIYYYK